MLTSVSWIYQIDAFDQLIVSSKKMKSATFNLIPLGYCKWQDL